MIPSDGVYSPGTTTHPHAASANDSTGARLEVILREYMTRLERSAHLPSSPSPHTDELVKPMNLMVVTDGGEFYLTALSVFDPAFGATDDP